MSCSIRIYRDADFDGVLSTLNAAARADGDSTLFSAADLRARLATPHAVDWPIDPQEDSFVAEIEGAGVVAYADGQVRGGPGAWMYRTWCSIRPEFRRQGIGRALLERLGVRTQALATLHGASIILGARAPTTQHDALALFEQFSMRPARHFFEMSCDLGAIPALQLPPDLQLRPWVERDDHAIWLASEEAFADHWGVKPEPFELFEHRVNSGRLNREGSFIAWDGGEIAGGALNDMGPAAAARRGQNRAWVGMLFVRRAWRKHGLGRALLIASLRKARDMGHAAVGLNVDAENLTGAVRLYESVGFAVSATSVAYHRVYPETV
jgi:mycothiol synthase